MDDETWVRDTLERNRWPVDEEALPYLLLVHAGIRRQVDALVADPTLGGATPEVDLDPSRAPSDT